VETRAAWCGLNGASVVCCPPPDAKDETHVASDQVRSLASAIVWMAGSRSCCMRCAPRSAAGAPQRLTLMADVLRRFFTIVRIAIAVARGHGPVDDLAHRMSRSPLGWHLMMGIGS